MDEACVVASNLGGILIFRRQLVFAGPCAEASDRVFIGSFQCVFSRETCTNHEQHDVLRPGGRIFPAGDSEDATIVAPVLGDIAEVRIARWKMIALKLSLSLIAPNDVPLGIAVKRVLFWSTVVCYASRLSWTLL